MRSNWLTRFLGFHDQKQKEKSKQVVAYAQDKKEEYDTDMDIIRKMAKTAHQQARRSLKEAEKTVKITEDITQKIALVTDKRRLAR